MTLLGLCQIWSYGQEVNVYVLFPPTFRNSTLTANIPTVYNVWVSRFSITLYKYAISCISLYIFWLLYFHLFCNLFVNWSLWSSSSFLLWYKLWNSSSERHEHKQYGGTLSSNATLAQLYVMVLHGKATRKKRKEKRETPTLTAFATRWQRPISGRKR